MKKFLMALAVLCLGSAAFAGFNAGGTLVAHDIGVAIATTDGSSYCTQGIALQSCAGADAEIDGTVASTAAYFRLYAAFPPASTPRMMGITFGIANAAPVILAGGTCGDFELPDTGWPKGPNGSPSVPWPLGNSVTWNTVQLTTLTPVYWFEAYAYPGLIEFGPNPTQGGTIGDDAVPAVLDDIYAYSKMGFDVPGVVACPFVPPTPGACCLTDGTCTFILQADCHGAWHAGFDCTTYACPLPTGSCCMHDGSCTVGLASACTGTWTMFGTCTPNLCPKPTGACCQHSTGACEILTQAACSAKPTAERWAWLGMDTICDPVGCDVVPVEQHSWGQIKSLYH
jgi:hypothetical protein